MNGIHDLGGMDGFGAVEVEAGEPVFHHAWERRVFGLSAALRVALRTTTDAFRFAIERMEPSHYLRASYYERWMTALATQLVENGMIERGELEARAGGSFPLSQAAPHLHLPEPAPPDAPPRFAVGSAVAVRNAHPAGHTRCPRYVRGKRGTVVRVDGSFRLPDIAAHSRVPCAEPAYGVRFTARELWGEAASSNESIYVDLWESYLELV